jgi:hypothetical protein
MGYFLSRETGTEAGEEDVEAVVTPPDTPERL